MDGCKREVTVNEAMSAFYILEKLKELANRVEYMHNFQNEAEKHGYNRTMVNQCCLENKKTHKGCTWEYTYFIEKQMPKPPEHKVHEIYPTLGKKYY